MPSRSLEPRVLLLLMAGLAVVVFLMIKPYAAVLMLAAVLAIIFEPLYRTVLKQLRSPSWSALLTTLIVLALVLLPLSLFGYQLVQEATALYGYLTGRANTNGFGELLTRVQELTDRFVPGLTFETADVVGYVQASLTWLLSNVGFVFAGFARILFSFVLLLFVFFYLVRDGEKLKRWLMHTSPLSDSHENRIIGTLTLAVNSVVRGSLVIALIQALVAGVGYTVFGVPNPALWAGVLMVASFVPTLGTALVQIPVVLYMLLTGDLGAAVGLAAWATVAVGLVDNFLGPHLIGRGTRLHPLLTLFAVLGGIVVFGPIGLLVGPVVFSLLLAVIKIWSETIEAPAGHSHG
ncbi:MAG TPA: AI-2E family transporter [Candidatus Paceibacterota bacterium]|nr:AI-2E family transporter [Candidatus Paceibacterota bacterium]